MRTEFRYSDLEDSKSYYDQFFDAIEIASIPYLSGTNHQNIGNYYADALSYFYPFSIIATYNRVCLKLFVEGEMLVGIQIIRMALDILAVIYAEYKKPFNILYPIYWEGKDISKVIKDRSKLRKNLDEEFGTKICALYNTYSTFVHPNINQHTLGIDPTRPLNFEHTYTDDLIYINQTIGNVLLTHLENINSKIKENEPDNV